MSPPDPLDNMGPPAAPAAPVVTPASIRSMWSRLTPQEQTSLTTFCMLQCIDLMPVIMQRLMESADDSQLKALSRVMYRLQRL